MKTSTATSRGRVGSSRSMKQRLILLCLTLASGVTMSADMATEQVLKQLEAMQKQIREQQVAIDALKAQLEKQASTQVEGVRETVKEEVDAALREGQAQEKQTPSISLGKGIDNLKLKGDLRVRFEHRERDRKVPSNGDGDRSLERWRARFRLGGVWKNDAESWEVGAGLATGDFDGPMSGASAGTSTNDTWGEDDPFETGDIGLDYAYAKHSWDCMSLTVGQHKNPYKSSFMLWDSDLRPTGISAQYAPGGVFATVGAYNVRYSGQDEQMGNMYGGQVGLTMDNESGLTSTLALAFYTFDTATTEAQFEDQLGALAAGDPRLDYRWDILDLYGNVALKLDSVTLTAHGQWCMNLGVDNEDGSQYYVNTVPGPGVQYPGGYDPEDENQAWTLGLQAQFGKIKLGYAYVHIEGDSIPYFIKDATFGSGLAGDVSATTNLKGHNLKASYSLTPNCSLAGTIMLYDYLRDEDGLTYDGGEFYILDLNYKF